MRAKLGVGVIKEEDKRLRVEIYITKLMTQKFTN